MNLKNATLLAIIGSSYFFVSRAVGTLLPDLFKNLYLTRVSVILSFLAALTILVFYISFYKVYVQKEQIKLKQATVLAIIGYCAIVVLHMKGLFIVFNGNNFHYLVKPHFIEPIVPWVVSIFILLFFVMFYREIIHDEHTKLKNAIIAAIIGSTTGALLRTFILFNYLYLREIRWFSDLPTKTILIFFPLVLFIFLTSLYFYITLYKEQLS